MKRTIARRAAPEVNAGSMADIAFLLLIFFLVTTTIMTDSGILVKLPPWEDNPPVIDVLQRNILKVAINSQDQLLVENRSIFLPELKDQAKAFIMNPANDPDLAQSPNKAIISLMNDRGTSYDIYLSVYNELKAAYQELWDEAAQIRFQKQFSELSVAQQRKIRDHIPFVLSEAEPTEY